MLAFSFTWAYVFWVLTTVSDKVGGMLVVVLSRIFTIMLLEDSLKACSLVPPRKMLTATEGTEKVDEQQKESSLYEAFLVNKS